MSMHSFVMHFRDGVHVCTFKLVHDCFIEAPSVAQRVGAHVLEPEIFAVT
jgi:hypothetical protein